MKGASERLECCRYSHQPIGRAGRRAFRRVSLIKNSKMMLKVFGSYHVLWLCQRVVNVVIKHQENKQRRN